MSTEPTVSVPLTPHQVEQLYYAAIAWNVIVNSDPTAPDELKRHVCSTLHGAAVALRNSREMDLTSEADQVLATIKYTLRAVQ